MPTTSDTLDLKAIAEKWLQVCGPHDYGVDTAGCSCRTEEDYRPDVSRLVAEVERLRSERDDMRDSARMYAATVDDLRQHLDRANAHRDQQAEAIAVYMGDVARLMAERDEARAEVARLRHLEDTARAWRAWRREWVESQADPGEVERHTQPVVRDLVAAVDALPVRGGDR